jgi:heme A synthase
VLGQVQGVHRLLAFGFLGLTLATFTWAHRMPRDKARPLQQAAHAVLGFTVAQIVVAAAMILQLLPTSLRAAHLLVGSLVWASLVELVFRARRISPKFRLEALTRAGAQVP